MENTKALLIRITEKYNRLASERQMPAESLRSLHDDFLVRYTHETTALEGNTLSLHETQMVLEDGIAIGGKLLREHLEVVNARNAVIWMDSIATANEPITADTILNLHGIIMRGILDTDAGSYRRQAVRIVGSAHIPPNWVTIPDAMDAFVARINEGPGSEHPISFAARAHIELAAIHPFTDGNGRVSRMIVNLLLMRAGYPPALYNAADRVQYLDTLERAQVQGQDEGFIAVTATAVEIMLDRYLEISQMSEDAEKHLSVSKTVDAGMRPRMRR
ncbi:MAG: Fic family protein [Acidimicrobiales bacterium]